MASTALDDVISSVPEVSTAVETAVVYALCSPPAHVLGVRLPQLVVSPQGDELLAWELRPTQATQERLDGFVRYWLRYPPRLPLTADQVAAYRESIRGWLFLDCNRSFATLAPGWFPVDRVAADGLEPELKLSQLALAGDWQIVVGVRNFGLGKEIRPKQV